jgi:hypothetical protein
MIISLRLWLKTWKPTESFSHKLTTLHIGSTQSTFMISEVKNTTVVEV